MSAVFELQQADAVPTRGRASRQGEVCAFQPLLPASEGAGDVGELYSLHAKRLERIVRGGVDAPQPVIEDACQFAWSRLLLHAHRIRRDTVLAWLVATAAHQALKLIRLEGRDLSLETMLEREPEPLERLEAPAPDEVLESRQRLADMRLLSARQQRLMWLRVLGLSYQEMAAREACTVRTVDRQLTRARTTMRMQAAA